MDYPLSTAALAQHIAFLGKTGSGKTTSAKGAVERLVLDGARVCILDPIKSDWWGLTSSADGKRPGFPFQILGGPRGHVPLQPSAGKAVGELVGRGDLSLSIIDMADFPMGGLQAFFNDFAPALMRSMRGVLHLVLEEAHEFAPKERAGIGNENMALYHAKKLATAGRSKGVRLLLVTQRTQSLHNALLGSCDTMVAHRLTAPADQKPVQDWLKAHFDKATMERVGGSLASLRTGNAWICSGETAAGAEMATFPPLTTFDNSATPTSQDARQHVTMASVDLGKLQAILGEAVEEAKANDPALLKKRIRELEVEVARKPAPAADEATIERAHAEAYTRGTLDQRKADSQLYAERLTTLRHTLDRAVSEAVVERMPAELGYTGKEFPRVDIPHIARGGTPPPPAPQATRSASPPQRQPSGPRTEGDAALGRGERAVLTVLAQFHPQPIKPKRAAAIAGYSVRASTWRGILAALRKRDAIIGSEDLGITPAGLSVLGSFTPMPTGRALLEHWIGELPKGQAETLRVLAAIGGQGAATDIASRAGYSTSASTWRGILAGLRNLCLVDGSRVLKLHEDLR